MQLTPTDRTTHRRLPERGSFDRDLLYSIIDEAFHCHVGFAIDGRPWVIPTIHARLNDDLYLHGSVASHMLRTLSDEVETCVTITIVDGLVLARSAFHHSMNYRSVMVFGTASRVAEGPEKEAALHALVEHVVRHRMRDARPPTEIEMRKTLVLRLPIVEASAKVRTGGPVDDEEDMELPIWAGQLPIAYVYGSPINESDATLPDYVKNYSRH